MAAIAEITYADDVRLPRMLGTDFACQICEPRPLRCPCFETGEECVCAGLCDSKVTYAPRLFKTMEAILSHLLTKHKLKLSEHILDVFQREHDEKKSFWNAMTRRK